jgi:positive phototaxis protein PixI
MLFKKRSVKPMTANTTLARLQQLLPQLFQPVNVSGNLYLRFQLTHEIPALLSMERVQEALLVPASAISPLPNLPEFTIGIMNARDRVFCVVDLGQLLGLPSLPTNLQDYQVVVIDLFATDTEEIDTAGLSAGKYLGLAVRRVNGVARFDPDTLQAPGEEFPACLKLYQMGCFGAADERVLVLDPTAIANDPNLRKNPFVSGYN